MKLYQDKNWKAVHFEERTVLSIDQGYYPRDFWKNLLNTEVEPIQNRPGHYKAV